MKSESGNLTVINVLSEVAWKPILALTGLPWVILGAYDLVRNEFIPIPDQDKLQILRYLPTWQWRTWALCSCAIFIVATLRGTYKALLRRHKIETELSEKITKLHHEAEQKLPKLTLEVWGVLFLKRSYPSEVFLEVSIGNARSGTVCTVQEYELRMEIRDQPYISRKIQHDLGGYYVLEVSIDRREGGTPKAEESAEELADVAAGINHQQPLVPGAPRRGWLHFSFRDIPAQVLNPADIKGVTLSVSDQFGGGCTFLAVPNQAARRRIEEIEMNVTWV